MNLKVIGPESDIVDVLDDSCTPAVHHGQPAFWSPDKGAVSPDRGIRSPVPKWTDDLWCFRFIFLYTIFASVVGLTFVVPGIEDANIQLAMFMVEPVLTLVTLILLVLLHLIDPGIVPPSPFRDEEIAIAETGRISVDLVVDAHGQWARRKLHPDGRSEITQRYCNTCNIWREPRTSHCSRCGYCMERFDHHCGAVGVCVARKNHRFFTAFLFTSALASILFFCACILRLEQIDWTRYRVMLATPEDLLTEWEFHNHMALTVILLLLALMYFYTSLLIFFATMHCTILLCDWTTKQYVLHNREGKPMPVPRVSFAAWIHNLRGVCCTEVRSKYVEPSIVTSTIGMKISSTDKSPLEHKGRTDSLISHFSNVSLGQISASVSDVSESRSSTSSPSCTSPEEVTSKRPSDSPVSSPERVRMDFS